MQCYVCLREVAQTQYKGSLFCIRCLWREHPKLKEIKLQIDKGTYNGKTK